MAITLKRNKKGTFDTTYSGFDAVAHNFGNTLEKIKSTARKVGKAVVEPSKRKARFDAKKELDDIARGFGSVENYEKLYPETKKRHDALRKRAYGDK